MAEAEKKMMQDDIISDDMLMVTNSDLFKGSEGTCALRLSLPLLRVKQN